MLDEFLDNLVHITINKDDIASESKAVQKFIERNSRLEFYCGGLKDGKKFDKVKEFKRILKRLEKIRKDHGGKESNIECLVYDQLMELMSRMSLKDLRRLQLEKLL
jgi:hypothetical protein